MREEGGGVMNILLVEDNPGDVELIEISLGKSEIPIALHVVSDGVEAMCFLRRQDGYPDAPRPDIVWLDLNLPRKNGLEVLAEIKQDPDLLAIPVIIISSSGSEEDVVKSYQLHANCFITKPMDFTEFLGAIKAMEEFWFRVVSLPPKTC